MARPKGFEPLTPRFVVWCSIQLSYGRAREGDIGAGVAARNPRLPGHKGANRKERVAPRTSFIATALTATLLLSACVSNGEFPSLAVRDVELDRSTEAPARPPVDIAADPALRQRIEQLAARAQAGARAFDTEHGRAAAAGSAAGSEGSESWVVAQQALSRLEAARAETMRALGDLDEVAMERAAAPTAPDDLAALNAAIAAVERLALAQQRRLDALRTRIAGR